MARSRRRSHARNLTSSQQDYLQAALDSLADFILDNGSQKSNHVDGLEQNDNRKGFGVTSGNDLSEPRGDSTHSRSDVGDVDEARAVFERFNRSYSELLSESIRFDYALRSMGSGGPGMEAASCLRKSLRQVQGLFKTNTMSLFDENWDGTFQYLEKFPDAMSSLAKAVSEFGFSLLDFVDGYYNEKLMRLLDHLSKMLQLHHNVLEERKFETNIEMQVYLHDILPSLGAAYKTFTSYLANFVDKGAPMIRTAQKNQADRYLHITTISTFLSAVTVSTLQIGIQGSNANSAITVAVNSFFFSSLIFSTASAVQSMLAMTWLRSFVRLPERSLPRWVFAWLTNGPTLSLLVAGAFFSMGLVLFVYSSQQDIVTSIFTTFFATIQTLGVLVLAVWFYYERWKFRVEGGDTGRKLTKSSVLFDMIAAGIEMHRSLRHYISELWESLTSCCCGPPESDGPPNVSVAKETNPAKDSIETNADDQKKDNHEEYFEDATDHLYHTTIPMTELSLHGEHRSGKVEPYDDQGTFRLPPHHVISIPQVIRLSERVDDMVKSTVASNTQAGPSVPSNSGGREIEASGHHVAFPADPAKNYATMDIPYPVASSSGHGATSVGNDLFIPPPLDISPGFNFSNPFHGKSMPKEEGDSQAFSASKSVQDWDEPPPESPLRSPSSQKFTGFAAAMHGSSDPPHHDEADSIIEIRIETPSNHSSASYHSYTSSKSHPSFAGTFALGDIAVFSNNATYPHVRPPSPKSNMLPMDAQPEDISSFGSMIVNEPLVMVDEDDTPPVYSAARASNPLSRFRPLRRNAAYGGETSRGIHLTALANVDSAVMRHDSISVVEMQHFGHS